ncbi:hypothetical protein [Halomicronema sp. CCY15110]|nr:hypothetical protein [Halomicronema sp. CCY15110]
MFRITERIVIDGDRRQLPSRCHWARADPSATLLSGPRLPLLDVSP